MYKFDIEMIEMDTYYVGGPGYRFNIDTGGKPRTYFNIVTDLYSCYTVDSEIYYDGLIYRIRNTKVKSTDRWYDDKKALLRFDLQMNFKEYGIDVSKIPCDWGDGEGLSCLTYEDLTYIFPISKSDRIIECSEIHDTKDIIEIFGALIAFRKKIFNDPGGIYKDYLLNKDKIGLYRNYL